jgi:hypothetical protein
MGFAFVVRIKDDPESSDLKQGIVKVQYVE